MGAGGYKIIDQHAKYFVSFVPVWNSTLASLQYTDVLQFTGHEEGRIRKKIDGTFAYDYFLKDHLGNTRMVLTEEKKTDSYPAASMETAQAATEQTLYANLL